jgi:saccharopine dehydrogenase (NAD+, L-lysine-forming)
LRAEARPTEQRAPIVPDDAARLVADGVVVTVEESATRAFPITEYAAAGCAIEPEGSWVDAPADAVVVGIKELPDQPAELRHPHVYFAHAFRGQDGGAEVLARFRAGGGELLDVEYLTLEGRRVVAFGYWAGYVGAALAVLEARGHLVGPLFPGSRAALDASLQHQPGEPLTAVVTGASGRSGSGACDALAVAGVAVTAWDRAETATLDRAALLGHDLLVNCVASTGPAEPFVRPEDLAAADRRLVVVADVTCDVTNEHNLLPINNEVTTWAAPTRDLGGRPPVRVIAIDNLPSLLPREASLDFSAQLTPLFADLPGRQGAWAAAELAFRAALDR